jgi:hypothetical protein
MITGKVQLNLEKVDVVSVIKSAIDSVKLAADAKQIQLNLLFDKGELGNTLYEDYQFGKFVQAFPATIPARSDLSFQAGSREEILGGWNTYANEHHLDLHKQEAVTAVTRQDGYFEVRTAAGGAAPTPSARRPRPEGADPAGDVRPRTRPPLSRASRAKRYRARNFAVKLPRCFRRLIRTAALLTSK